MRFVAAVGARLVAGLVVLAWGCSSPPSSPTPPVSSSATGLSVSGTVRDTALRPVGAARVEIVDGPHAGASTQTDDAGRFAFTGLTPAPDSVTLQVTKPGFALQTATVRNRASAFVTLSAAGLAGSDGRYRVGFTGCDVLPPALRTRSYEADVSVSENGNVTGSSAFVVALGGGEFYDGYDRFTAWMAPDEVLLSVYSLDALNWWLEDQPVFERVHGTGYLSLIGRARAVRSTADAPAAASFDGTIGYCAAARPASLPDFPPTCEVPVLECRPGQSQVTFTRR